MGTNERSASDLDQDDARKCADCRAGIRPDVDAPCDDERVDAVRGDGGWHSIYAEKVGQKCRATEDRRDGSSRGRQ
jgi:hypothetical protein